MKNHMQILAFTAFALLGSAAVSSQALAQDTPQPTELNIIAPEGWEDKTSTKTANQLAIFTDPKSEHKLEVLSRPNTRKSHADILFEAFNKELKHNFSEQVRLDKNYNLKDGSQLVGKFIVYETRDLNVPIYIATFSFTHNETAYIVVGYFASAKRDEGRGIFDTFIRNLTPKVVAP